MKKVLVTLLAAILGLSFLLTGCSEPELPHKTFSSEKEMRSFVEGLWREEGGVNVVLYTNEEKEDVFGMIFDTASSEGSMSAFFGNITPESNYNTKKSDVVKNVSVEECFYEKLSLKRQIVYDYANGSIKSNDGHCWCYIAEDGTLVLEGDTKTRYKKISDDPIPKSFRTTFEECKSKKLSKLIYEEEYASLPTAKDVQYDKYGYRGQRFYIEGTAELDDYYNWDYRCCESTHFCMFVIPNNGSYSSGWHIYASRSEFEDLFNSLKKGSRSVSLVCVMKYPDTGADCMATLDEVVE